MKRLLSLLLCCVMLMTLSAGCKKNNTPEKPGLTDTAIAADLAANHTKYNFAHINAESEPTISDFKVSNRTEADGVVSLSVTATAITPYATIDVAADMEYTWELNYWRMSNIEITKAIPTVTAAPNLNSVKTELSNYISIVGSALAVKDEESHNLQFSFDKAAWSISRADGAQTATLNVAYQSDELTFTGYYTLTFGEAGWTIESEEQESGQHYPLMHLITLEQTDEEKK